jgi:hypothetical protein
MIVLESKFASMAKSKKNVNFGKNKVIFRQVLKWRTYKEFKKNF